MRGQTGLVLLHGSELGGWVWERVVPRLRHPALALDLPGRSGPPRERAARALQELVDDVVDQVGRWTAVGPVVLVVHSASGVLAPAVAAALGPRLVAVVFVAASVPARGRSWVHLQPLPARVLLRLLYRLRPAGMLSPRAQVVRLLCAGLDDEATALVLDRRVPEPRALLFGPVTAPELTVPVHVVDAVDDLALSPSARARDQDRLAGLTRSPVVHEVPGGHLPMLGCPSQVAELLDRIAGAPVPVDARPGLGP